ncbi:MAG: hypothetical protein ACK5LL_00290 [Suipraeoptans sp.]
MSSVLLDNLDLPWVNLLIVLVFWDELWYINNNLATWVWKWAKEQLQNRYLYYDFLAFAHADVSLLDETIRPISLTDYFSHDNEQSV